MEVYLFIVFIVTILGYAINPNRSRQRKKMYIVIVSAILIVVSGFRAYSVGADTRFYVDLFTKAEYIVDSRFEEGFMLYLRGLNRVSKNPDILLITSSIISITCLAVFAYKYSKNVLISMVLYVSLGGYFMQMSGIRQTLATALLLQASSLVFERKRIKAAILIVAAYYVHNVAVVAAIPYILWVFFEEMLKKRLTPKTVLFYSLGISAVAFLSYSVIMRIVEVLFPYFSAYFSGEWGESNYSASLANTMIQVVFLVVGVFYFRNRVFDRIELYSAMMMFFSVVCSTLSMRMEIWSRVAGMFTVYTALIWAPAFSVRIMEKYERAFIEYGIIVLSVLYMSIVLVFRPEWTRVVPYISRLF